MSADWIECPLQTFQLRRVKMIPAATRPPQPAIVDLRGLGDAGQPDTFALPIAHQLKDCQLAPPINLFLLTGHRKCRFERTAIFSGMELDDISMHSP